MLDELLLGDPTRRFAFGLALLFIAGLSLGLAGRRSRRSGDSLLTQRTEVGVALSLAPVGLGIVFSAFWGLLGAIVFLGIAIAVCGIGVLVMLARGA